MCNEIWNLFQACQCRVFQNTFPCHLARRCQPDDDLLLAEPIFLPAKEPKLPPGLLDCKQRKATRPVPGLCSRCKRAAVGKNAATGSGTETPASTSSGGLSVGRGREGSSPATLSLSSIPEGSTEES